MRLLIRFPSATSWASQVTPECRRSVAALGYDVMVLAADDIGLDQGAWAMADRFGGGSA